MAHLANLNGDDFLNCSFYQLNFKKSTRLWSSLPQLFQFWRKGSDWSNFGWVINKVSKSKGYTLDAWVFTVQIQQSRYLSCNRFHWRNRVIDVQFSSKWLQPSSLAMVKVSTNGTSIRKDWFDPRWMNRFWHSNKRCFRWSCLSSTGKLLEPTTYSDDLGYCKPMVTGWQWRMWIVYLVWWPAGVQEDFCVCRGIPTELHFWLLRGRTCWVHTQRSFIERILVSGFSSPSDIIWLDLCKKKQAGQCVW